MHVWMNSAQTAHTNSTQKLPWNLAHVLLPLHPWAALVAVHPVPGPWMINLVCQQHLACYNMLPPYPTRYTAAPSAGDNWGGVFAHHTEKEKKQHDPTRARHSPTLANMSGKQAAKHLRTAAHYYKDGVSKAVSFAEQFQDIKVGEVPGRTWAYLQRNLSPGNIKTAADSYADKYIATSSFAPAVHVMVGVFGISVLMSIPHLRHERDERCEEVYGKGWNSWF